MVVSIFLQFFFCEFAKYDSLDEFAYELAFPSAVMNVSEIFLVTRNVLKLGVDGIGFLTHRQSRSLTTSHHTVSNAATT